MAPYVGFLGTIVHTRKLTAPPFQVQFKVRYYLNWKHLSRIILLSINLNRFYNHRISVLHTLVVYDGRNERSGWQVTRKSEHCWKDVESEAHT